MSQPRVVVAGTKFGQVYLEALARPGSGFTLAGILGQGSPRSKECARHYGVPLVRDPADVPDDVGLACVVVRGGLLGGAGADLAQALLARGIHVLQEHPLHHDELAGCLRAANRAGVVYHLNSFYVHTAPVRQFLAAAAELLRRQPARYVAAACGFQMAYSLLDIVGRALGGVHPWGFGQPSAPAAELARLTDVDIPFRSVDGVVAGVPLTLRIQNQMDPADPDNYAHLMHRVTIGTEGGSLTLVGTHGPTVWSPRPDFPRAVQDPGATPHFAGAGGPVDEHLDVPSVQVLGPGDAPSYRQIFGSVWPAGVRHAVTGLWDAARAGEKPTRQGQYHLTLCRMWQDLTARLGPPDLVAAGAPRPLTPADVGGIAAAAEAAPGPAPGAALAAAPGTAAAGGGTP